MTILIAVLIAFVIYVSLAAVLRRFWIAPPKEPDPEMIEEVDIRFYCGICGSQVIMTMAPQGEIPDPPRHCREDMLLQG